MLPRAEGGKHVRPRHQFRHLLLRGHRPPGRGLRHPRHQGGQLHADVSGALRQLELARGQHLRVAAAPGDPHAELDGRLALPVACDRVLRLDERRHHAVDVLAVGQVDLARDLAGLLHFDDGHAGLHAERAGQQGGKAALEVVVPVGERPRHEGRNAEDAAHALRETDPRLRDGLNDVLGGRFDLPLLQRNALLAQACPAAALADDQPGVLLAIAGDLAA